MTTLYHYVHCPFCLRVRMGLGLLKIPYKSEVLPYDEEEKPLKLTGKKMLPILEYEGEAYNESLEILRIIDENNRLKHDLLDNEKLKNELEDLLSEIASPVHNLVMPYWIYTKEFDESSRQYFLKKKEAKRGPFPALMERKKEFLDELDQVLLKIEPLLKPYYGGQKELTICDIMLASHLWGMYLFPEFQFPPYLHHYLQEVKRQTSFEYHIDFWIHEIE